VPERGDCRFENTVVMPSCPVTSCVHCSCSLQISIPLLEFRNHEELWNAFMVGKGVSEQFTTRCDNSSLISEDLHLCQDLQWMQVPLSSPHPHQTHCLGPGLPEESGCHSWAGHVSLARTTPSYQVVGCSHRLWVLSWGYRKNIRRLNNIHLNNTYVKNSISGMVEWLKW
jgi:hypothetical protein